MIYKLNWVKLRRYTSKKIKFHKIVIHICDIRISVILPICEINTAMSAIPNNELNLYINLDNEKFSITKSSSTKPYVNQNKQPELSIKRQIYLNEF